jgi:hypothetical protein
MNNEKNKVGFFQVMGSVAAAMFGVQKEKNRERDFTSGKLWHYIAGGLLFTAIFITILVLIVRTALSGA